MILGKKKAPLLAGLELNWLNYLPMSSHLPPYGWNKKVKIEVEINAID